VICVGRLRLKVSAACWAPVCKMLIHSKLGDVYHVPVTKTKWHVAPVTQVLCYVCQKNSSVSVVTIFGEFCITLEKEIFLWWLCKFVCVERQQ
jgi:hypothetical protein